VAFYRELRSASGSNRLRLYCRSAVDVLSNAFGVHADILGQDLTYTFRTLRRAPGFTITAVMVAALGIDATTASFAIADHVLLRPLPFSEPAQLVKLWENQIERGYSRMEASPPNFLDWKRLSRSFDDVEAYTSDTANLVGSGDP